MNSYACKDHDFQQESLFRYCLNATISDNTASTKAVFYESINDILNVSCRDMVMTHGNLNPTLPPNAIRSIKGIPKKLHIGLKKDGSVAVNKVKTSQQPPTNTRPQDSWKKKTVQHLPGTLPFPNTYQKQQK